jgi:hypothetical protein
MMRASVAFGGCSFFELLVHDVRLLHWRRIGSTPTGHVHHEFCKRATMEYDWYDPACWAAYGVLAFCQWNLPHGLMQKPRIVPAQ